MTKDYLEKLERLTEYFEPVEDENNSKPNEALKSFDYIAQSLETLDDIAYMDCIEHLTTIKQYILKAQEQEKENSKYKQLEKELGCPLDVLLVGIKAVKNGIYAIDLPNENKLKYIPDVALSNVGTEWFLSNHCDFCVNVRDYKTLYWLKENKSE